MTDCRQALTGDKGEMERDQCITGHTLDHPRLPAVEDDGEVIRQVEQDRLRLSELAGYEVVGFAYPCGGVSPIPIGLVACNP